MSPGRVNFEGYNASRGGLTHDGKPTPGWDALPQGVRDGWEAGASAVLALRPHRETLADVEAELTAGEEIR